MKTILAFAIASILLTSCSKEVPHTFKLPSSHVVVMYGKLDAQRNQTFGKMTRGASSIYGNWTHGGLDFQSPDKHVGYILFYDRDDISYGSTNFECTFFGSTLTGEYNEGVFSGKGTWTIIESVGTMSFLKNGAGTLTYTEERSGDWPDYTVVLSGAGR